MCHGSSGSTGQSLSTESPTSQVLVQQIPWELTPYSFIDLTPALAVWMGMTVEQFTRRFAALGAGGEE